MAFYINNNVNKMLRPKSSKSAEGKTGVYKITWDNCESFYIDQTGRAFIKTLKKHLPKKYINKSKSNYACHLMSSNQNYTDFETPP